MRNGSLFLNLTLPICRGFFTLSRKVNRQEALWTRDVKLEIVY
ncbi:hypothetical protein HMPREF0201_04505 [Cedecea davisae DSM 4568]|uniref:Uncharacterized protein n=1 Tax=Cedecea davisae DSM 4568 TaxID=566551 RepID=S3IZ03_9ENTR|nr:hypothetical protein HMPREF0201_04505 [Cedecea davisae DSM 4568]